MVIRISGIIMCSGCSILSVVIITICCLFHKQAEPWEEADGVHKLLLETKRAQLTWWAAGPKNKPFKSKGKHAELGSCKTSGSDSADRTKRIDDQNVFLFIFKCALSYMVWSVCASQPMTAGCRRLLTKIQQVEMIKGFLQTSDALQKLREKIEQTS